MSIDIPRYTLLQPLGKGRFAEVWLAEHRLNKRRVAIKILNESRGDAFDPYAAFVREAEVLAGFDTPDIVRIYDNGPVDSRHYIVMEYVPGGTLETQMSHGPFEPARTIDCISRMLRGLVTPTRPHGSVVAGRSRAMRTAAALSCDGSIRLPTKGVGRLSAPCVLQAAEAICVKSPASIAAVGTNRTSSDGRSSVRVPW